MCNRNTGFQSELVMLGENGKHTLCITISGDRSERFARFNTKLGGIHPLTCCFSFQARNCKLFSILDMYFQEENEL